MVERALGSLYKVNLLMVVMGERALGWEGKGGYQVNHGLIADDDA